MSTEKTYITSCKRMNADIEALISLGNALLVKDSQHVVSEQAIDNIATKCDELQTSIQLFRHDMKRKFNKKGAAA